MTNMPAPVSTVVFSHLGHPTLVYGRSPALLHGFRRQSPPAS
jgi:hypothetical protein